MKKINDVLALLRHAYSHLAKESVTEQRMFADGLIAPAIRYLERQEGNRD